MKKIDEETVKNFRDKIAGYIEADLKKQQEEAEEKLQKAEKREKETLENRKKERERYWKDKIDSLRAELKALDDEAADNELKLKKLKEERTAWLRDNSTESVKKVQDLDVSIKETEKAIKKDKINKKIEDLESDKDKDLEKYDKKIKKIEESYKEELDKTKKKNNDLKLEELAYQKTDMLLKGNHQDEIIKLLVSKSKSYKDVGA